MSDDPDTDDPARTRRRGKRILLYAGLVVAAVLLGIGLWVAAQPAHPPLQGEVDADSINVSTKTLARVKTIRVHEGDRVKAGEVLATLSSPEIANGQAQAQAALDSARAAKALADAGTRADDVASLKSTWLATRTNAEHAATSSARADRLYAEGVISTRRRDQAHTLRDHTAHVAQAAKAQYLKAIAGTRPQTREMAAAQVRIAAAALATANSLEQETRLTSPIAGEVSRRLADPGELVGPLLPVIQVIDIDHPYVVVNLPENHYDGMTQGQEMDGRVPALDRSLRFRVYHISPQGEFATFRADRQSRGYDVRAFRVKLRPAQAASALRPGMSVLFDWPQ